MRIEEIKRIIQEPQHGEKFYTKEMIESLVGKVASICKKLEITRRNQPGEHNRDNK